MEYKARINLLLPIFFGFILLSTQKLHSQSEVVIKTGGDYYWTQIIDDTFDIAKAEARTELIYQISQELKDIKEIDLKTDVNIDSIGYLTFERGPKKRVVAFVLKKYIKNIHESHTLNVIQLNYTESSLNATQILKDTISVVKKVEEANKTVVEEPQNIVNAATSMEKTVNTSQISDNTEDIIGFIINSKYVADIEKVMQQKKYQGTINYGVLKTSTLYPERCYLLVFDPANGEIKALLDKGSSNIRFDLITKKDVETFLQTYNKMNIVWIQIY